MFAQDLFLLQYYDYRPFKCVFANKIVGNITKYLGYLARTFLPVWFKIRPGISIYKKKDKETCPAVITMTSFPQRICTVKLVVESLLRQSVLPKLIVLYLSKEQFEDRNWVETIFESYLNEGLMEIRWVDGDIRSHKKYWYAVGDFPSVPIITVDDDLIYASDTISNLLKMAAIHRNAIPCMYAHRIYWNCDGSCKPYSQWSGEIEKFKMSESLFCGTGGGTYFPIGSLRDANVDLDLLIDNCPTADDIWINAIIRKNGFYPIALRYSDSVPSWKIPNNKSLSDINNGQKENDVQLDNVQRLCMRLFGVNPYENNAMK